MAVTVMDGDDGVAWIGGERFLTTEDVASLFRTSPETVRWWRHVGKGPRWFKMGRRVLYAESDVQAAIRAARENGEGERG